MKLHYLKHVTIYDDPTPTSELSDTEVAIATIFDNLAQRGRFDEQGGELPQADWEDARAQ